MHLWGQHFDQTTEFQQSFWKALNYFTKGKAGNWVSLKYEPRKSFNHLMTSSTLSIHSSNWWILSFIELATQHSICLFLVQLLKSSKEPNGKNRTLWASKINLWPWPIPQLVLYIWLTIRKIITIAKWWCATLLSYAPPIIGSNPQRKLKNSAYFDQFK